MADNDIDPSIAALLDNAEEMTTSDSESPNYHFEPDAVYLRQVRHARGVMHLDHVTVLGIDIITYVRHGSDDVHIELAVETFLHDLHVQ